MRRTAVILSLLTVLAAGGRVSDAQAKGGVKYKPTADAYVTSSARHRNFGHAKALLAGSAPVSRVYLQFSPTGIDAPVTGATLRLFARAPSRGFTVRTASSSWRETRITFANAPRPGGVLGRSGRVRRGRWISIDVTRYVKGNGPVSFSVTGAARLASREAGSSRPELLVSAVPPTLLAAGDIGYCGTPYDEATAAIINKIPGGTVAALGDLAYEDGSAAEFASCYQPSWGAFKARTRPAPGNHEYNTPNATGYFGYWGAAAGNPAQGWYSYDLGGWHVVSLNSNCDFVGGCQAGSPEETWLRADLAAHKRGCTLAYWHHPLFSGGQVEYDPMTLPLWQALYDANADLVLAGHAHNYQRFAPQNPAGVADPARGIREFVVGTGGNPTLHPVAPIANTEIVNNTTWGVLQLTLRNSGYDWHFLPIAGQSFTDSGSQACH